MPADNSLSDSPNNLPSTIPTATLVQGPDPQQLFQSLLQQMDQLVQESAMAMFQLNTSLTKRAVGRARQLAQQAAAITPELRYLFLHLAGFVDLNNAICRILRAQTEADYEAAQAACREAVAALEPQLQLADEFLSTYPDAFQQISFAAEFKPFFSGARLMVGAMSHSIDAEQHLFKGDIPGYLRCGTVAADLFSQAHDLVIDCTFPTFAAIREVFWAQGNQMTRRLNYVRQSYPLRSRHIVPAGTQVFVVHGHDLANRDAVVAMLRQWGVEPAILVHQAHRGRTVIEKFEQSAADSCYAVVLFTPDDQVSNSQSAGPYGQARPNVLFELGWFYGRYGPGQVCILKQKAATVPSDLGGIACVEFDKSAAEPSCRDGLLIELTHAGLIPTSGAAAPTQA